MKKPTHLFLSACILTILLLSGRPAAAQEQDPITISVDAGFDGYYKPSYWTPLQVTLANSGPDVEGDVVVELSGNSGDDVRYRTPVSLPGQSRKTVSLVVGVDNYQASLVVRFESGRDTLAKQTVRIRQLITEDLLVGVVSGELADLSFLTQMSGIAQDVTVAYLKLDSLPDDSVAWDALDLLVLNDVDTATLDPAQRTALEGWVAAGGHLLATGGPNWQKTSAGLADLLPVQVTGSASVYDLSALDPSGTYAPQIMDGPFVAAEGVLQEGKLLLVQDELPLLARRSLGLGTVDWLALDLALAPLRDWAGNERLWQVILSNPSANLPWANSVVNTWAAREGLRSIPSLSLPSALQMVAFSLFYTLIVGPVTYLILKRLKRVELAWVAIPACILLFSALAYGTGFQLRGGDVIINRLTLVYGTGGGEVARARSLFGIFSPSRGSYDIEMPEGTLARPVQDDSFGSSEATVAQNGATQLQDVMVDVAGLRAFRADADIVPPAVSSRLRIELGNAPRLLGQVHNESGRTLLNCGLLIGDNLFELGDMEPNDLVNVDEKLNLGHATPLGAGLAAVPIYSSYAPYVGASFPIDKLVGGASYYNDKDLNRRFQIIQALASGNLGLLPPQSAVFYAWADDDPALWPVEVAESESQIIDTIGYFLQLPLALDQGGNELVIPPALTTWQTVEQQWLDQSGPYNFYLAGNWASFQYQPWEDLDLAAVTELRLRIDTSYSAGTRTTLRVALWDWNTETWVTDENLSWGENVILAEDRWLDANNAVRVRVEVPDPAGISIERMDVTFVGEGAAE